MSHYVIDYDEACKSCNSTGLYKGLAERDGFAVVCHTCEGSGKHHVKIEYDDFEERKKRDDVTRVLEVNPGICVGPAGELGGPIAEDQFGGQPYDQWFLGHPFSAGMEMRNYTCPAWWYQSADSDKKPNWNECIGGGSFSSCQSFYSTDIQYHQYESSRSGEKSSMDNFSTSPKIEEAAKGCVRLLPVYRLPGYDLNMLHVYTYLI